MRGFTKSCWKFQLSISLGRQKSPSTIQPGVKLNKPFLPKRHEIPKRCTQWLTLQCIDEYSLYTFLISASTDSFKLIIFFFLVLWLAEIGFTIFCVIWMKNHYAVCAISTGNKNMILGKGTMILGWQPIETIEITIVWISWMSLNFVRFHEILFQTDAEINSCSL